MAIIRLVNAINEEVDSRETLNIILLRQFILFRGIHFRQNYVFALELRCGGGVFGGEGLAVAAPGRVELDHYEAVALDGVGEVLLLQNDDVLLVHLGLLVRLRVLLEVAEIGVIVVVVAVLRRGGGLVEEAEVLVVGEVVAEGEKEGGEEEEGGEREHNEDSHCESEENNNGIAEREERSECVSVCYETWLTFNCGLNKTEINPLYHATVPCLKKLSSFNTWTFYCKFLDVFKSWFS